MYAEVHILYIIHATYVYMCLFVGRSKQIYVNTKILNFVLFSCNTVVEMKVNTNISREITHFH